MINFSSEKHIIPGYRFMQETVGKSIALDKDVHQSPIEEKGQAKETGKN